MTINFPSNPVLNQTFVTGYATYVWNGVSWVASDSSGGVSQGVQGGQGRQGLQGYAGSQGLQGTQGTQGLSGESFNQGSQGTQGNQGSQGVQGERGNQGTQGFGGGQGLQGTQGSYGLQGSQGRQGLQGTQGIQGYGGGQGLQGNQGTQGRQGLQGTQGRQGSQGLIGDQGTQGLQGLQGDQGLQGLQGRQGRQGLQGTQGSQGIQGLSNQGVQGTQGSGTQGSQGLQGIQGTQGRQGPQGTQGNQGLQGLQGDLGNQGLQGLQGTQGFQGLQGTQGRQGAQGFQGLQGTQGLQGLGNQGDQGTQGTQGLQGIQGPLSNFQGTQGALSNFQGTQGTQGLQGRQGAFGPIGPQGTQGTQGTQGRQGLQGLQGTQGLQGLQGLQGNVLLTITDDNIQSAVRYPTLVPASAVSAGMTNVEFVSSQKLSYIPASGKLGINTSNPTDNLTVVGTATATEYYGGATNLVGIVTQLVSGIGVDLFSTQEPGKGIVTVQSYKPIGKTIYVSQTGNDSNTGLAENYPKRTIKAAAAVALYGDTIKVFPGVYVEENPIVLAKTVSVEGTELRNIVITPKYLNQDLFHVNNGCHITDASFIGPEMTNGAAIVALQPLLGVSDNRFFDAARMIRINLDYIAKESVGFLTSGFSGFAGGHREQDAGRLIDNNLNYIAAEAVGFLTSPSGYNFTLNNSDYTNCKEDIVSIFAAISDDLKANSNKKSIGAGYSYFNSSGGLIHITGIATQQATIAALNYAAGIATHVINNLTPSISYQSGVGSVTQYKNPSVILVNGGCVGVGTTIKQLVGIVTNMIGAASTSVAPPLRYGVNLDSNKCSIDVTRVWKGICFDITRGGNSKSVQSGKSYYDDNWNLIPSILKNPGEVEQTIATFDYSFNIARAIVNNCTWGGYPAGIGSTSVVNAVYDRTTGITTITVNAHGLKKNDPVKIVGLGFTCNSGPGTLIYPDGSFGYIFPVHRIVGVNTFEVVVGVSTLDHFYTSGGTVEKYTNFQKEFTQVKDLSIQSDPETGFNNSINSCSNVISALRSCVGVTTTIVGLGSMSGITTSYPGNSGQGFESVFDVYDAIYEETSGRTTITAPGSNVKVGDRIEIRDLVFKCQSGGPIINQKFPSGRYGYEFYVDTVNPDGSFVINVGISTLAHTYVTGGYIVNRSVGVTTAVYDNVTGITTITAPGAYVRLGDLVELRNLEFSCTSGAGTTTLYPTGNLGYSFEVKEVIGSGTTFVVNTGVSTIAHTYVSGGIVLPPYSRGVGPITQGPYIRNCTNFVPNSIGMKVDGFAAEPGDQDDIGVTGTMSVDSYTQYNQGGIGVSITNGAYAQLVSIFTICDDIAIYTGNGGQCDLTNSNASFGNYGLFAEGVGDNESKSIYRYTGEVVDNVSVETDTIAISGIGSYRPYDGQALYFGELFYTINKIEIIDGGSGYTSPPTVIIDPPTGPNGIGAEGSANIENGKIVSVDVISTGNQYRTPPNITFSGGGGVGAAATAILTPIYYYIESATLPNNAGISTVTLTQFINSNIGAGTTVYFNRLSLQIATTISFEWVGAGTNINTAKPALGGVTIPDNEVEMRGGGRVVYTSTNQAGNFKIGDDIVINQLTGTISGRAFSQSLLNTVTPLILGLSR